MSDKSVYLAYKKAMPLNTWHVIGILSYKESSSSYSFRYTKGAYDRDFRPFNGMEELYKEYNSKELYPLFKNRILYEKRPEYSKFIDWLGLEENANPLDILSLSGGQRITDTLQTFGKVEVNNDGSFSHSFFMHGLSFLDKEQLKRIQELKFNEKLYFCLDSQNDFDKNALLIRSNDPKKIVGYCPRYLSETITKLLLLDSNLVSLKVETVNENAPLQYRLRCKLEGVIPDDFKFSFNSGTEFTPILDTSETV